MTPTAAPTHVGLDTPPGRGGIAVIRLAGPHAAELLASTFRPVRPDAVEAPGRLRLGHFCEGDDAIDEVLAVRDGEMAEIHLHGGPAAVRRALIVLRRLGAEPLPSARLDAATVPFGPAHPRWGNPAVGAELQAVLCCAEGELLATALAVQWSDGLSRLAAETVSAIDAGEATAARAGQFGAAADGFAAFQRMLAPPEVVLVGPPNAGKSTLANALIGREVSLVHAMAGTTRDWVRERAFCAGVPVWLTDTAGLWSPAGDVDALAVERARDRAAAADLVVLVLPGGAGDAPDWLAERPVLRVASRMDEFDRPHPVDAGVVCVSAATGAGLATLRRAVRTAVGLGEWGPSLPAAFTPRQRDLCRQAADALTRDDAQATGRFLRELLG